MGILLSERNLSFGGSFPNSENTFTIVVYTKFSSLQNSGTSDSISKLSLSSKVNTLYSLKERAKTSNPGPKLALEAGTDILSISIASYKNFYIV